MWSQDIIWHIVMIQEVRVEEALTMTKDGMRCKGGRAKGGAWRLASQCVATTHSSSQT